jgi:tetratricopeptide (TPR) repeat protein
MMTPPSGIAAIPPLEAALARYRFALTRWKNATERTPEQALEILTARDSLQKALKGSYRVPLKLVRELTELDAELEKNAASLSQILNLALYRNALLPATQAWWWYLDSKIEDDSLRQLNWLWKGARFGVWTVNLGMLGTLATRFFSGSSGLIEALTIALPSILVLLQANNELTSSGREGVNRLLNRLKIPPNLYEEARFVPTALLFIFLLIIWSLQPQFSREINREGRVSEGRGQLTRAERSYLKAIALNPNNLDATYNLGMGI